MNNRSTSLVLIVMAVLCAMSSGCGSSSSHSITAESADHDGLEHHIPEHKPKSFDAAVPELRRRLAVIRSAFESDQTLASSEELTEFEDIVNWLPELAADSDMHKPEWDQVHEIAKRLQSECIQLSKRKSSDSRPEIAIQACAASIAELAKFLEFSHEDGATHHNRESNSA